MRNWAGNLAYRTRKLHEPRSLEEVQEIARSSSSLRALGSRHSFNDIADTTGAQISLAQLPRRIEIDPSDRTVTVDGGIRYGELCGPLHAAGFALHNLASLPHISVAGACATGTHGSGDRSGGLATAIVAMELVTADGDVVTLDRKSDSTGVDAAAVSLGVLGVVTSLTLEIEPSYSVRQRVYEDLPLDQIVDHFDEIASSADSVSLFTEWRGPATDMVWLKRRVPTADHLTAGDIAAERFFGATPATLDRHPIRRMESDACTPQLGVAGPWHERLPHFRMDHMPSSGAELQSEYLVPREHAVDALLALDTLRGPIAELIQVAEIRTVASDGLWLSMAFDRASVAFHFTWKPDAPAVERLLPRIEACLRPFEPRPHWGKVFTMHPDEVRSRYPRLHDFLDRARRLDPGRKFSNAYIDRLIYGAD